MTESFGTSGSASTGPESGGRPAFGGQRPPDSGAGAADPEPVIDDTVEDAELEVVEPLLGSSSDTQDPQTSEAGEPEAQPETDPLAVAQRERDEFRDALQRLQADFENYKKRIIKQQTDHLERAAGALVEKLLPVLDTTDLALAHGGGEDIKQLTSALTNVLEKEGLERIDPVGQPFDPTLHDAVAHEPGDGGPQEVVEVLRAGYRWKGRVLRPAMVKVRG